MATMDKQLLLKVRNLKKYFPVTSGVIFQREIGSVKAVDDISFDIFKGETLGLVGESGCGKSTVGRTILQLYRPTAGQVEFDSIDLVAQKGTDLRGIRRRLQMIFQDPYSSLNPRMTVGEIITEPLKVHGIAKGSESMDKVRELLDMVGLNPDFVTRYPHEFSGGQRQRIAIARALAVNPDFIICDEPISALDVSIQAQIVNLLEELQSRLGLTYLFIAHDLSMVRHISHRVAVMYLGKMVELTDRDRLYDNPQHPYTQLLIQSLPSFNKKLEFSGISGLPPTLLNLPVGCSFNPRCPFVKDTCKVDEPVLREVRLGQKASCHLFEGDQD